MLRRLLPAIALIVFSFLSSNAQIFYKIEGKDLKSPSYLFGTHHLAPISILDEYPTLKKAIEETLAIVGEIDMTQPQFQLALAMQPYMMAPTDSTMSQLLPAEEFIALDKKFQEHAPAPGISLKALDPLRPMVVTSMITMIEMQKSMPGFDAENQLDSHFQKIFADAGKKLYPLETAEQQAKLLYTSTPITSQLDDLKEVLNNPGELIESCTMLNEAYKKGDLTALLEISKADESDPAFMNALLTKRNQAWMKQLPVILSAQPALVVVGALHLAGDEGLVTALRNKGYTVTPIK